MLPAATSFEVCSRRENGSVGLEDSGPQSFVFLVSIERALDSRAPPHRDGLNFLSLAGGSFRKSRSEPVPTRHPVTDAHPFLARPLEDFRSGLLTRTTVPGEAW